MLGLLLLQLILFILLLLLLLLLLQGGPVVVVLSLSCSIGLQECRDGCFTHIAVLNVYVEVGLLRRLVAVLLLQVPFLLSRLLVLLLLLFQLVDWRLLLLRRLQGLFQPHVAVIKMQLLSTSRGPGERAGQIASCRPTHHCPVKRRLDC